MRRALSLFLLAIPALALGQTTGIILTSNTMNISQCQGSETVPDLNLGDQMDVDVTWTVTLNSGVTTIPTDGTAHYTLYAATQQQGAWATTNSNGSCTTNSSGNPVGAAVNLPGTTNTDIIITGSIGNTGTITARSYALADIASKAGVGCTSTTQAPIYLCAQLFINGTPSGFAVNGTVTFNPTAPTVAPTAVHSTPGDGKLHLSCTGGTNISSFKAIASLGGTIVSRSNQASACDQLVIGGLTNGQQYSVVVYGISNVNNPGPASTPALSDTSTIPIPTNDFWEQYKQDGGPETGGCSTGGAAAGLAGALSMLLVLRRRKS